MDTVGRRIRRLDDPALERGDAAALLDRRARAPHAAHAHPRFEHLMPMFFSLGACFEDKRLRLVHRDTEFGSLTMEAFSR